MIWCCSSLPRSALCWIRLNSCAVLRHSAKLEALCVCCGGFWTAGAAMGWIRKAAVVDRRRTEHGPGKLTFAAFRHKLRPRAALKSDNQSKKTTFKPPVTWSHLTRDARKLYKLYNNFLNKDMIIRMIMMWNLSNLKLFFQQRKVYSIT